MVEIKERVEISEQDRALEKVLNRVLEEADAGNTVTKATLSLALSEELGFTVKESKELIEVFYGVVLDALVEGREVKLSGFGNWKLLHKKPRPGRNPRNLQAAEVSERFVTSFRSGNKLNSMVKWLLGGQKDGAGSE